SPLTPEAAAVFSEAMIEPKNVPCCQLLASVTSGTTDARRPPNKMASIGTPLGSSHSLAITGHWLAGAVNRAFACAAVRPDDGVQERRIQSTVCSGVVPICSHHTSPSSVSATLE